MLLIFNIRKLHNSVLQFCFVRTNAQLYTPMEHEPAMLTFI